MDKVHEVALRLLELRPIRGDLLTGMILHPYESFRYCTDREGHDLNLLNSNDYEKYMEYKKKELLDCTETRHVFYKVQKPYRTYLLKEVWSALSKEELGKVLTDVWKTCDYVNEDHMLNKEEYTKIFRAAGKENLMEKEELEILESLPDVVTVYRGISQETHHCVDGMSWTSDEGTARWFADRFGSDGSVYKLKVDKKHILAFYLAEMEVVIDYNWLKKNKSKINEA